MDVQSGSKLKISRVRFNKKVHVSPTPPGSDASSSDFRRFHSIERNYQLDGPQDSMQDEQERGRARKNILTNRGDFAPGVEEEQLCIHAAASATGSSVENQAEAHAWVRGGRLLKRALSESPSREDLIAESRCQTMHGVCGSYRPFEKPTDGLNPQYGSRNGFDGSCTDTSGCKGVAGRDRWW
jgi:hypothetical protein